MGAIITTTARVYLLTLKAVKESPIRLLRWRYPVTATVHASAEKPDSVLPDPLTPRRWHVGYAISHGGHAPDWQPMATWDDGKKMYVLLPITALYGVSPVIRGIGPNGPMLLNSRQYQNVIVIDQLAPRLELRVGIGEQAEVVTIARSALETIDCPGESRCPLWPSPSTTLRRQR